MNKPKLAPSSAAEQLQGTQLFYMSDVSVFCSYKKTRVKPVTIAVTMRKKVAVQVKMLFKFETHGLVFLYVSNRNLHP